MTDHVVSGYLKLTAVQEITGTDRVVFDPHKSSQLVVPNLIFRDVAQLVAQPANARVKHEVTIDFDHALEAGFVGGPVTSDDVLFSDPGVWFRDGSHALCTGRRPTPMAHMVYELGGPANPVPQIELDVKPSGWQKGDTVVVCPTAYGDFDGFEERVVVAVHGVWVSIDRPLEREHPMVMGDGTPHYPEVLHVERNVEFNAPDGHPHMHIESTGRQQFTGVCWDNFGVPRDDLTGRYPVHVHHTHDTNRGATWSCLVVQHSGQRAFVPHESNGITWDRPIAYDINREAYWWDPASKAEPTETNDNTWLRPVAAKVTGNHEGTASFELRNGTGNKAISPVAVGNVCPGASAGSSWPTNANGTWLYTDAVNHNNRGHGIYVWQNTGTDHLISNAVNYRNGRSGILDGSYLHHYVYEGGADVGNGGAGLVQVAVSDNRGVEPLTYRDRTFDGDGRSLFAVAFAPPESSFSDPKKAHAVHFERDTLTGYTDYAIGFVHGADLLNPPRAVFVGCTVDDMATLIWMPDWLDPAAWVQWDDLHIVPAHVGPTAGFVPRPEWNALVQQLAPVPA